MHSLVKKMTQAVIEFFILIFLALLPVISIYLDVVVLGNDVGEISVTELTQESLLLLAATIFLYGAWKKPVIRGFLILVASFFSCLFIREMDAFLDNIWHGFWFWPALLMALVSIYYARFVAKNTTQKPLTDFINTKPYFLILIGLIVLLVLSRTFGSGNLLWHAILEENSSRAKTVVQEGLELMGYAFIFYGSLVFNHRDYVSFLYKPTKTNATQGIEH